ncbi:MAG: hypothetical protein O9327_01950 [Polaromonas sp.]|nr:hypothetical protein [Polaromonas sp.]
MLQNQTQTPMPFKTFGGAIDGVRDACVAAAKKAHADHYGTPAYFIKRAQYIHQAFDEHCARLGMDPAVTAAFRKALSGHAAYYRYGSETLRTLFSDNEIPDTHLVRGQWVSSRARLSIH